MVKKRAPLGALFGLTLETGILLLPAFIFLLSTEHAGHGALFHEGALTDILLMGAGFITAVPLLLFSSAAKRIPLSLTGILQYIAPTLQFLIGVMVYKEPFSTAKLVGFAIVWAALGVYAVEGYFVHRNQPFPVVSE